MPDDNSRLVYSTDGGRARPAVAKPAKKPRSSKSAASPALNVPDDGVVRLHRGKAGKGGKSATLITGLPGSDADLDSLLKQLKQSLGAGGSREGRTLALQGDQREKLRERLETLGYRVKLAGG